MNGYEPGTVLLIAVVIITVIAFVTFRTALRDGRGHTPPIRSQEPWQAGNLPSRPYSHR